jgi:hypothetical protein
VNTGAVDRRDFNWQLFFAASGVIFAVLCFIGLEAFWPQPPDFDLTAAETAQHYIENQSGYLIGVTFASISMAFYIAWAVQVGAMLAKLEGGSRMVTLVGTVCNVSTPFLLAFDVCIFAIAAYRPGEISPEITQMLSDFGWIASMLIWPPLMAGMLLWGIVMLRTSSQPGGFPRWLGWATIVTAIVEPGQAGIIFEKSGPFAPDGALSWYLAVFTWGPWIVAFSVVMVQKIRSEARTAVNRPLQTSVS